MLQPKIVALGGGTGLAVLLKELRHYPADLTAIVTGSYADSPQAPTMSMSIVKMCQWTFWRLTDAVIRFGPVFDSGRHSGALRKNLGILPPGDIRNCLVALSDSGSYALLSFCHQGVHETPLLNLFVMCTTTR